jgi:hypothetical protein
MKSIAMLSLLVAGSLTGCGDEEVDSFGSLLVNGELAGFVEVEMGGSVSFEFQPGNELVDLTYRWSAPAGGGEVTRDDSRLASFTAGFTPGRYNVVLEVEGTDRAGKPQTRTIQTLIIVKMPDQAWTMGFIDRVTFDGVPRPHGGTSNYSAGQAVSVIVDEVAGATNANIEAEVSAGQIERRGYKEFRWTLPAMLGADATIDIRARGRVGAFEVDEAYTHLIRTE